jgi:molecular chaperone DnaK
MTQPYPVGIDLGTTFSAAAWVDQSGRTAMVRNIDGELLMPSVVQFADAEVIVGKDARAATTIHPEMVAQWVKRDMGLPYYTRPIHGRKLPPEVIQACILRRLKEGIVAELGEIGPVVITVPAYFDEPRRKATADAAEMAGLEVLDIVNEPTAAALSFGETLGYLRPSGGPTEELTVFIYDLGGGTFDATLLRISPGKIQTLATDGDVMLGGHDWDMRLVDYVAERFKRLHKRDPRNDPVIINRVLAAAVEAKHALSARSRTSMRIEVAGQTVEVPISRDQFEELTADLLERTAHTTRELLKAANMDWPAIDRLLLVGGATRMPMVGEMLEELSGKEPEHSVNPDEAVARGAALYAAWLKAKQSADGRLAPLEIGNVNAHSLGVEGIDQQTLLKRNVVLIPRNTPLPTKRTERFATRSENQRSIALQILEGESSSPEDCSALGRTVIRDLPPGLPRNWPVEVTFEYAANGRLHVAAEVPGTERRTQVTLDLTLGMTRAGLERWKNPVVAAAGFDSFERIVLDALDAPAVEPLGQEAIEAMQADFSTAQPAAAREGGWRPLVAGPRPTPIELPAEEQAEEPVEEDPYDRRAARLAVMRTKPAWILRVVGHVIAAVLGLMLGYAVLSWLRPEMFPFPWK